jgi:AcrR family transcriptional regulator
VAIGATATRTSSNRAQRREQLLDAADRIICKRGPAVSMEEIASEAGITKPILYRHFGDKDGLYEALAERYVNQLMAELDSGPVLGNARDRLAARIDAYLSYVERNPERYRFLLSAAQHPGTAGIVAEFRERSVNACAARAERSLRRAGLDPEIAEPWAHAVSGMIRSAGIWWLETRSLPRMRLVEYLTALLWEGFAPLRRRGDKDAIDVTRRNAEE